MRWICLRCRAEYGERPPTCGGCLSDVGLVPMPDRIDGRDVASAPRVRAGVVLARDLRSDSRPAPFGAPFDAWTLGDPCAVELLGPPGGGKSTCATAMAVSASRRVDVLYVAVEEGHARTLVERLQRAGLDDLTARRLRVGDGRTLHEIGEDLRAVPDARLVIVDSVTELGASPEQLVPMLLGRSWIVVSHVNARGNSHGGSAWSHAVDVVVDVIDGKASPRKNRFGGMCSLNVWDAA